MRLGLSIPIEALGLAESVELAYEAERLGFTDVWSSEVAHADGFTPLAAVAARTERIRLGLGLAPVSNRPAALLAMSAAGMQVVSGGRFVLGVGSSSNVIVERWMGGAFELPLTRVRETVQALRLTLAGEKTRFHGRTLRIDDFRLGLGATDVPIVLGALGPRMLRLAGEVGDGVLINFNTARTTAGVLRDFREGAIAAGRDPDALEVICRLPVAVDEDDEAMHEMLRRFIAAYGTVDVYNAFLRRQGFEREADAMAATWAEGRRRDALAAVSERLLRGIAVLGSPEQCIAQLREFLDAGVDTLLIGPITAVSDAEERRRRIMRTIATVAGALGSGAPIQRTPSA